MDLPPELLSLLRFGRGVDNRRLKAAGFQYRYTTRGGRETLRPGQIPAPGPAGAAYRYERDVEEFFRHSAAVARPLEDP